MFAGTLYPDSRSRTSLRDSNLRAKLLRRLPESRLTFDLFGDRVASGRIASEGNDVKERARAVCLRTGEGGREPESGGVGLAGNSIALGEAWLADELAMAVEGETSTGQFVSPCENAAELNKRGGNDGGSARNFPFPTVSGICVISDVN